MHVQDPCGIPFIIMRKKALHFLELDSFFVGEVFPFAMNVNVWSSRKDVMRAFWLLTLPSIVHCTHPIGTLPISILPELDIIHSGLKGSKPKKNSPGLRLVPFFVKLPHESPQKI